MLKSTIRVGFYELDPITNKKNAKPTSDIFQYTEPSSFDEMLVDSDQKTILEFYNAHRRVVCQNTGGRSMYIAWKTGKVQLDEIQKFMSEWKPGMSYAAESTVTASKNASKALNNPESAAIIALSLGITLEQLMAMRKSAALLSANVPETNE